MRAKIVKAISGYWISYDKYCWYVETLADAEKLLEKELKPKVKGRWRKVKIEYIR